MSESKCYCYEKFKANLPKDFEPKCFREKCQNWRNHQQKEDEKCTPMKQKY